MDSYCQFKTSNNLYVYIKQFFYMSWACAHQSSGAGYYSLTTTIKKKGYLKYNKHFP